MTVRSKTSLGIVVGVIVIAAGALWATTGKMPVPPGDTGKTTVASGDTGKMPVASAPAQPEVGTVKKLAPVAVTVVPLTVRPIQRTVPIVGSFFGYDEVTVTAKVPGTVVKIHHDVGDAVAPGDPLVELDRTDYELAVSEGRRALEFDVAKLGIEIPPQGIDVDQAEQSIRQGKIQIDKLPMVLRAKEQQDNALSRLNRAKRMREQNILAQEEYDTRVTEYEVAVNNWAQAMLEARAAKVGVLYRLALLKTAEQRLRDTRVVVPLPTRREGMPEKVEYVVSQRKVTEGEMVKDSPGSSAQVFKLVMDAVLKLQATVPERYIGQVRKGQPVEIHVEAYADQVFNGEVSWVNPTVDRTSRTFLIEVRVPNTNRRLKAGGFAKAEVLTHVDAQGWTVPSEAVLSFAGSTKILVARDGKAHAIPIVRGVEGSGWVEVVRSGSPGLTPADLVITSGLQQLAEGSPIAVRDPRAAAVASEGKP